VESSVGGFGCGLGWGRLSFWIFWGGWSRCLCLFGSGGVDGVGDFVDGGGVGCVCCGRPGTMQKPKGNGLMCP